jgi:hypothetical protein
MTWNNHGSRRPARKSFPLACEPLEDRNLLSGFNIGNLIARLDPILGGPTPPLGALPPIGLPPDPGTLPPISLPGDPSQSPVTVSKDMLQVTPGGDADSYTLVLNSQPTADVTITINQGDPAVSALTNLVARVHLVPDGSSDPLVVTPTTLTFTSDNWNVPQTVKVSAPASAGSSTPFVLLSHSVSSTDSNFNNVFVPDVFVQVGDVTPPTPPPVQTGGVQVSTDKLDLTPGGPAQTYTLVLTSQPTANVTINISQGDPTLTPLGAPTFGPGIGNSVQLTIDPTTLTFTPDDWNTPQTITVSAPATATAGDITQFTFLSHMVTSDDPNYNDLFVPNVFVRVSDVTPPTPPPVQTGGVQVSTDKLDLTPGGPAQTYTLVLTSQPTANVTITISQEDPEMSALGGAIIRPGIVNSVQLTIDPTTLTFTPDNWNVAQTVSVSAPADPTAADLTRFTFLSHTVTSDDPNYNDVFVPNVFVRVGDVTPPVPPPIQTGGVEVSAQRLEVTPGGPAQTYTVVLTSQPTADVTITIAQGTIAVDPPGASGNDITTGGPLVVTPTTLTFTHDNWNQPQTVTVSLPADATVNTPAVILTQSVTSDDPNYNGIDAPSVFVHLAAAATPGLVFSTHHLDITAGDTTGASYTLALATKPTANVTVTIEDSFSLLSQALNGQLPPNTSLGSVTVTPQTLTFTPDNWNVAQTVTVTAPAPGTGFSLPFALLFNTLKSDDPNYNNIFTPPVFVAIHGVTPPPLPVGPIGPPTLVPPVVGLPVVGLPISLPPIGVQPSPTAQFIALPPVPPKVHAQPAKNGTGQAQHTAANNPNGGHPLIRRLRRRHRPNQGPST